MIHDSKFLSKGLMPSHKLKETLLANSIITKLWPLDPSTIVNPRHGPKTTIGTEKTSNPLVGVSNL